MSTTTWKRLATYLEQQREYLVFVGVRTFTKRSWARVVSAQDGLLFLEGRKPVPLQAVRSFVVAYPDGTVLDGVELHHPLPAGIRFLVESEQPAQTGDPDLVHVRPVDLERGGALVQVVHDTTAREAFAQEQPDEPLRHSSTLRNNTSVPVHVTRFGCYQQHGTSYEPRTITGRPFEAKEFEEWYLVKDGWIAPGTSVSDPNNYTSPGLWWLYHFVLQGSSEQHVTGAPVVP